MTGARAVFVPRERMVRWCENFATRHEAASYAVSAGSLHVTAPDGASAVARLPFGEEYAGPADPVAFAAAVGTGAAESSSYVLLSSAAQEEIPDEVLGRVLGVISFVHRGSHATGLLLVSPLFAVAGARPLFAVAGVAVALVGLLGAFLAQKAQLEHA